MWNASRAHGTEYIRKILQKLKNNIYIYKIIIIKIINIDDNLWIIDENVSKNKFTVLILLIVWQNDRERLHITNFLHFLQINCMQLAFKNDLVGIMNYTRK